MISDGYLKNYKLPIYNEWQFAKFDNEGKIFAMTENLTFKNDNKKHLLICVFTLSGNIGENGLHEKVNCHYFATDEKTYLDDGSCDEVFEKITFPSSGRDPYLGVQNPKQSTAPIFSEQYKFHLQTNLHKNLMIKR